MARSIRTALLRLSTAVVAASLSLMLAGTGASGQAAPPKPPEKMDHSKMEMMDDHASSGWKELDAYHVLMMATWHPAKGKDDLAPLKAKAGDMAKAAKTWSESKAPKGCDTPKLTEAVTKVNAGSQELAALVAKGSADAMLKTKLASLHETFEIVEGGCKPAK